MESGIEVAAAATVRGKTDRATQRKAARRGGTFCESSCCVATRVTPPEPVSPAAWPRVGLSLSADIHRNVLNNSSDRMYL